MTSDWTWGGNPEHAAEVAKLEAEIERLRAALHEIANKTSSVPIRRIASAALEPKP